MLYRNVRTGVVMESEAEISGGSWQVVTPAGQPAPAQEKKPAEKKPPAKRTKK